MSSGVGEMMREEIQYRLEELKAEARVVCLDITKLQEKRRRIREEMKELLEIEGDG